MRIAGIGRTSAPIPALIAPLAQGARLNAKWNFAISFAFFLIAKPFTLYRITSSTNDGEVDGGICHNFSGGRNRSGRQLSTWIRSSRSGLSP